MSDRLALNDIAFGYDDSKLLNGITLAMAEGAMLVIAGSSGSGKSTLLEIAAGLVEPLQGTVAWYGRDIRTLPLVEVKAARRRMGFMFQSHALISNLSLFENVALPLRYHHNPPERELTDRVMGLMRAFGIATVAARLPEQVSRGEARMASFARAVVMEPELLLLDEPTSGIDPAQDAMVYTHLAAIRQEREVTVIIASHSRHVARELGCREVLLESGRIVEPPGSIV